MEPPEFRKTVLLTHFSTHSNIPCHEKASLGLKENCQSAPFFFNFNKILWFWLNTSPFYVFWNNACFRSVALIANEGEGIIQVLSICSHVFWLSFFYSVDRMSSFLHGCLEPNIPTRHCILHKLSLHFLYPHSLAYQLTRKNSVSLSDSHLIMDLILSHLRLFSEGIFATGWGILDCGMT